MTNNSIQIHKINRISNLCVAGIHKINGICNLRVAGIRNINGICNLRVAGIRKINGICNMRVAKDTKNKWHWQFANSTDAPRGASTTHTK